MIGSNGSAKPPKLAMKPPWPGPGTHFKLWPSTPNRSASADWPGPPTSPDPGSTDNPSSATRSNSSDTRHPRAGPTPGQPNEPAPTPCANSSKSTGKNSRGYKPKIAPSKTRSLANSAQHEQRQSPSVPNRRRGHVSDVKLPPDQEQRLSRSREGPLCRGRNYADTGVNFGWLADSWARKLGIITDLRGR
jgi:hypothetical protein